MKKIFYRVANKEVDEPVKLKKHKVIAQVFAKRRFLNSDGRLSISIHNTYQDPVGRYFNIYNLFCRTKQVKMFKGIFMFRI